MFTMNPVHTARLRATTLMAAAASALAVQSTALACVTPLQVRNFTLAESALANPARAGTTQVHSRTLLLSRAFFQGEIYV
jgi:hypothetical protein